MGFRSRKVLWSIHIPQKLIHYFNKHVSKWRLVVPMYYISTSKHTHTSPHLWNLELHETKLVCGKVRELATFVHRLDFAIIMTMNHHWYTGGLNAQLLKFCKINVEAKFEVLLPMLQSNLGFAHCYPTLSLRISSIFFFFLWFHVVSNDWSLYLWQCQLNWN